MDINDQMGDGAAVANLAVAPQTIPQEPTSLQTDQLSGATAAPPTPTTTDAPLTPPVAPPPVVTPPAPPVVAVPSPSAPLTLTPTPVPEMTPQPPAVAEPVLESQQLTPTPVPSLSIEPPSAMPAAPLTPPVPPTPPDQLEHIPEVFPEPTVAPAIPNQPQPPLVADSAPSTDDKSQKSPLEILEEILAGASAEKTLQDQEAAAKKAKEDQEAAEAAQKQAAYQADIQQKIAVSEVELAAAKQQQSQVEAELVAEGKVEDNTSVSPDDGNAIHQLVREVRPDASQ